MANIFTAALDLLSSDPTIFAVVFGIGFLAGHLVHAIRYGFGRYGTPFVKLGYFVKYLFFLRL